MLTVKHKLIKHAATLLRNRLSEFQEDYPKRFPKSVLREIQDHNEMLRIIAIDIAEIGRSL